MKFFIPFLVAFLLQAFPSISQTRYLEPGLEMGPYRPGFQVFHEYDYSRTRSYQIPEDGDEAIAAGPRPIQISVWYPAVPAEGQQPMPFRTYIELVATEIDFGYDGDAIQHPFVRKSFFDNDFMNQEQLALALEATSGAYRDAEVAPGSFPVILYSPGGYGRGFENSVMFEYLASHGFIVAAYPAIGGSDGNGSNPTVGLFETQTRDLEFVLGFLHQFPGANTEQLGLMGFSLGGSATLTVPMRNPNVKAVASLDGWHPEKNLSWMPFIDPERFNFPFLFAYRGGTENPNRFIYDKVGGADAYALSFKKFGHVFYGSAWILLTEHKADDWAAIGAGQEDINRGYNLLCRYVRHFFRAYLLGDEESKGQLKTLHEEEQAPDDFLTVEFKEK